MATTMPPPPPSVLHQLDQTDALYCLIVDEDRAFYDLDSLLDTFNIRLTLQEAKDTLRERGIIKTIFGNPDLIQFHDFIKHVLYPNLSLPALHEHTESIRFLYDIHSMTVHKVPSTTSKQQSPWRASWQPSEHAILNRQPLQWRPGDIPHALRFELLERGVLPRRYVGLYKKVGAYLFDACALLMAFHLLGDEMIPVEQCQMHAKRLLDDHNIAYVETINAEVFADFGKSLHLFSR